MGEWPSELGPWEELRVGDCRVCRYQSTFGPSPWDGMYFVERDGPPPRYLWSNGTWREHTGAVTLEPAPGYFADLPTALEHLYLATLPPGQRSDLPEDRT